MLRLLTLAAVAGFAAAETCEDLDCTAALTAGGASGQTVSKQLHCVISILFCRTTINLYPLLFFSLLLHLLLYLL